MVAFGPFLDTVLDSRLALLALSTTSKMIAQVYSPFIYRVYEAIGTRKYAVTEEDETVSKVHRTNWKKSAARQVQHQTLYLQAPSNKPFLRRVQ